MNIPVSLTFFIIVILVPSFQWVFWSPIQCCSFFRRAIHLIRSVKQKNKNQFYHLRISIYQKICVIYFIKKRMKKMFSYIFHSYKKWLFLTVTNLYHIISFTFFFIPPSFLFFVKQCWIWGRKKSVLNANITTTTKNMRNMKCIFA